MKVNSPPFFFSRIVVIIVSVATAWVVSEWLFFVTKPSFMSLYSPWEKAGVLFGNALVISLIVLIVSLPFIALGWLFSKLTRNNLLVSVVVFLPASSLLAATFLLLIDNFTMTLVDWGVRDTLVTGIWLYRVLTVGLFLYAAKLLYRLHRRQPPTAAQKVATSVVGLINLAGLPLILVAIVSTPGESGRISSSDGEWLGSDRPNILLLSGDGIWAEHMSLYGYHRTTTPFLDSVRDEFLIAENHFSNASDTGGSVISLLTGKLPTTTKVIYPPDVLRGKDSFQHLPGILKKLGYYNIDISVRHYADPYDLNLREGFAEANSRKLKDTGGPLVSWLRSNRGLNPTSLLADRITERFLERYGHIWKNQQMLDPLDTVKQPEQYSQDKVRMTQLRQYLDEIRQPFFLHMHMMGTHGPRFVPRKRTFSKRKSFSTRWHMDGYDDAIVDFDLYVSEIYELLKDSGMLDFTILVVSSDHGLRHDALHRIPMMMRLPRKVREQNSGESIGGNTQRLDIAPTLLDAIGIQAPDWMEGQSMLAADRMQLKTRPIFSSRAGGRKREGDFFIVENPQPPWYSMAELYLISCNQGYTLNLSDMDLKVENIEGSTLECESKLSADDALQMMLAHLRQRGYEFN